MTLSWGEKLTKQTFNGEFQNEISCKKLSGSEKKCEEGVRRELWIKRIESLIPATLQQIHFS